MICRSCRISYSTLVCPGCVEKAGRIALERFQFHPLRHVVRGRAKLVTREFAGTRHIQMFGWERTFCDQAIEGHARKSAITLDELNAAAARWASKPPLPSSWRPAPGEQRYCSRCHDEVKRLIAEACLCSA